MPRNLPSKFLRNLLSHLFEMHTISHYIKAVFFLKFTCQVYMALCQPVSQFVVFQAASFYDRTFIEVLVIERIV